jgi:hypothetical protein
MLCLGEPIRVAEVAAGQAARSQRYPGHRQAQLVGGYERLIGRLDGRRVPASHVLAARDAGQSIDQLGARRRFEQGDRSLRERDRDRVRFAEAPADEREDR